MVVLIEGTLVTQDSTDNTPKEFFMATAILNLDDHTLSLKGDDESVIVDGIPVIYRETESVDQWVERQARKRGFTTTGEPFDYRSGFVYRLRKRTDK
jgi:hypothetical protein